MKAFHWRKAGRYWPKPWPARPLNRMKPFRFTLQAVQTLRQRHEQKAREHYGRALLAHRQALEQLQQVEIELKQVWEQISGQLPDGIAAERLAHLHLYARSVEERRTQHAEAIVALERNLQQAAENWRAARRQCEVVEKCRLQQKNTYRRNSLAQEQK